MKNKLKKEDLDKAVKKVDETMTFLNKEADSKIVSKMKGMEAPILLTLAVMLLVSASTGTVVLGAIVLAVATSPKWMPVVLKKVEEAKAKKQETKTEEVKAEVVEEKKEE